KSTAKNGCGGGVGCNDKVPRGAEGGECEKWQQERVEAGDHRHAGDAGVAEHLRDVHRGKDNACKCIAHCAGSPHRFYSLVQTEQIETPAWRAANSGTRTTRRKA